MSEFTTTPKLGLYKPKYNQDAEHWGDHLNANADTLDLTISGLSTDIGGPFLPLAGGQMAGPLTYYADGGATALRSVQGRAADVANVLDFGADPTGAVDATAAIRAAVATGKRVYIPHGRYTVTDAITISTGQIIEGDGRSATLIQVGTAPFNMSAAGVFVFAVSAGEQGSEIRDLWFRYQQPSFPGVARADMIHYPPAINTSGVASRFKLINVQITNAWDGVVFNGGGAGFIDRLEMSAYHIGLNFGATAPLLDAQRVENFHFWVFDLSLDQRLVMTDGQTIGAQIGRVDELMATNWSIIQSLINVTDTAGTGGYYMFANLHLDGPCAQLNIVNPFVFHCVNLFYSKNNTVETPAITVSGGLASFHNVSSQSSMNTSPTILVSGGIAAFSGGNPWVQQSTTAEHVRVTGGKCMISDVEFGSHFPAHTVPLIHQSGTGILIVKDCTFTPGFTGGVAIQMDSDTAGSAVQNNVFGALTFTPPGTVGQYSNKGDFYTATVHAGQFVAGGAAVASTSMILHATGQKTFNYYNNNVIHWAQGATAGADDWALLRYNDAGAAQANTLTISRATGIARLSDAGSVITSAINATDMPPPVANWRPLAVHGSGANIPTVEYISTSDTTVAQQYYRRSRGTPTGLTAIASGDHLGVTYYQGYDGTAWSANAAIIRVTATANWTTSVHDTALNFYAMTGTTAVNSLSLSGVAATFAVPITLNAAGPTIRAGAGAATGTQPKGSLWMRTDGAAGSTLYVSQGAGTWAAVAGV